MERILTEGQYIRAYEDFYINNFTTPYELDLIKKRYESYLKQD